jgi:hypothetical protein
MGFTRDFRAFLDALCDARVDFVVIGGVAPTDLAHIAELRKRQ